MTVNPRRYLVIAGPTGSGKSALAMVVAEALNGEIISCDSVQLYRGFDVGAAKATVAERVRVRHHLLDYLAWSEAGDAGSYGNAATAAKAEITARGHLPLVVGGTGLYLRALLGQGWHAELPQDAQLREMLARLSNDELHQRLRQMDPRRAGELHGNDRVRLLRSTELVTLLGKPLHEAGLTASRPADPAAMVVVIEPPRPILHTRIAMRTTAMLENGLIEEVQGLLQSGVSPQCKPMQSIGYKQVCVYLDGRLARAELADAIIAATRQYAKRQCTWFRSVNADLRLDGTEPYADVLSLIKCEL